MCTTIVDQQANLSQLTSLTGGQTGAGGLTQAPIGMGIGLGGLGGIGGGMGTLMNDNSSGRLANDGGLGGF